MPGRSRRRTNSCEFSKLTFETYFSFLPNFSHFTEIDFFSSDDREIFSNYSSTVQKVGNSMEFDRILSLRDSCNFVFHFMEQRKLKILKILKRKQHSYFLISPFPFGSDKTSIEASISVPRFKCQRVERIARVNNCTL